MCQHSPSSADTRRDFLKKGALGLTWGLFGLSLPTATYLREAFGVTPVNPLFDGILQIFYEGGPSQTDTWDPKPGSSSNQVGVIGVGANDVYGKPIYVAEHFRSIVNLVQGNQAVKLGLVRSVTHGNGDHGTAQEYMNCFWGNPVAPRYPSFAATMAHFFEGRGGDAGVPSVMIRGGNGRQANTAKGSGIATALSVGSGADIVQELSIPQGLSAERYERRRAIAAKINEKILATRPDESVKAWDRAWKDAYDVTTRGTAAKAFDLTGKTLLKGQPGISDTGIASKMTLAQELLKAGVPYVALGMGGNDSHSDNRAAVAKVWGANTDPLVAELAQNLAQTGKRYLIVMGGEFGRTPASVAGGRDGRDHWGRGFSWAMLSVNQPKFKTTAVGDTGPDGLFEVKPNKNGALVDPISPGTLGAFLYKSMGLNVGEDAQFNVPTVGGVASPVDVGMARVAPKLMGQFGLA